jgi:hypothetical protein
MMDFTGYGMWWHPASSDTRFAGQLTWAPGSNPTLALLDPPPAVWSEGEPGNAISIDELRVPLLHGQLAGHGPVSLLGCHFGGMSIGRTYTHTFRVAEVLVGVLLDAPEETWFRRVKVTLPTLSSVLGPGSIRMATSRLGTATVSARRRQHVWKADDVTVEWRYQPSLRGRQEQMAVVTAAEMHPTSPRPQSVQFWARRWVNPIVQLLDVLTGTRSNASSVTLWNKKHMTNLEMLSTGIELHAAAVGEFDRPTSATLPIARVADVERNPGGLPDVVARFIDLQPRQEVFLELLSSSIRDAERPLRNRYLDLTAALEAFDSQSTGVGPITLDRFKEDRRGVLRRLSTGDVPSEDRRFINKWLASMPSYPLEQRLRRLRGSVTIDADWTIGDHRMAAIRNQLAHGITGFASDELREATDQALSLARRLVLRELGIDR